MFLFYELNQKLSRYLTRDKIDLIAIAFLMGADAHENQLRRSGELYFTHPVAVAGLLADLKMDPDTIIAALLHDVVEDTNVTNLEVQHQFGPKVAALVEGATKLDKIEFQSKAEAQAENFRKMVLAMVEDVRVILIKIADRLHNMRTLGSLPPEKRRRIARETLEIYVPIANRLGMNTFKGELEELGFAALHPIRYRVLKECVRRARGNRQKLMEKIRSTLVERLKAEGISSEHILGREKRLFSIFKKMKNKRLPFSEIMDVYGFRIIAKSVGDCYRLLGVVHSLYTPVPGRFKDYIAIPKANGYQSLHTTLFGPYGVPIEIQIRTLEMDHLAENGIAAHWIYKEEGGLSETEMRTQAWMTSLLETQAQSGSSLDFIENVKFDLYPDEVYVFTPAGDIMKLPRGATVIDFAYSVHTEIGHHCAGVRINRRPGALSQVLVSGQTVEIVTEPRAKPSPAWLNFAITGKAKGAIKHFLKSRQEEESISLGRKLLNYSLSEFGMGWESIPEDAKKKLYRSLTLENDRALFQEIGLGERPSVVVAHQLMELLGKPINRIGRKRSKTAVTLVGAEGLNAHYAECCYPIPGDPIRGWLEKGQGIQVHRLECAVLSSLEEENTQSLVPLNWAEEIHQTFPVAVYLECKNTKGAIADIATAIATQDVNIERFNMQQDESSSGTFHLIVKIQDRIHLAKLIRHLRHLKVVMKVARE